MGPLSFPTRPGVVRVLAAAWLLFFASPAAAVAARSYRIAVLEVANATSQVYIRGDKQFTPSNSKPTARGDVVVFYDEVFDYSLGTKGDKIALSAGSGTYFDAAGSMYHEAWTYNFIAGSYANNSLEFSGYLVSPDYNNPIAVTGGTGALFKGAKGQVTYVTTGGGTDFNYTGTIVIDV